MFKWSIRKKLWFYSDSVLSKFSYFLKISDGIKKIVAKRQKINKYS